MNALTIDCPIPPSANNLWRAANKKGHVIVYRSSGYDRWLRNAWVCWLQAKPKDFKTITGDIAIEILVAPKRQRDCDNSAKAACDMLQKLQIVSNDSQAKEVTQKIVNPDMAPSGCRITVTPL